jgi:hypothetical protein
MELVARHNISSGKKGERLTIKAGQRFNPEDYPGITGPEWEAMMKNGNIAAPDEPNYATPTGMQPVAVMAEPVEGRSGRTDIGSNRPAEARDGITVPTQTTAAAAEDDDDDDDDDDPPAARRRRRRNRGDDEEAEV